MDIFALILGFFIGVVALGIAIEIGIKKSNQDSPTSKHANKWSISEISNPRVMAEYLSDVDLPKNSKVIVNQYKDKDMLVGMDVKHHKGIKGNYILGDDRALILSGPIKNDEVGFWTVDEDIVNKLNQDFNDKWSKATNMKFEEETKKS